MVLTTLIWLGCAVASLHILLLCWKAKIALTPAKPRELPELTKNILDIIELSSDWRVTNHRSSDVTTLTFDEMCVVSYGKEITTVKLHDAPMDLSEGDMNLIRRHAQSKLAANATKIAGDKLLGGI